jgi:hypothetical protein
VLVRGPGSSDEIRLFFQYHNCRCVGEPADVIVQRATYWVLQGIVRPKGFLDQIDDFLAGISGEVVSQCLIACSRVVCQIRLGHLLPSRRTVVFIRDGVICMKYEGPCVRGINFDYLVCRGFEVRDPSAATKCVILPRRMVHRF